VGQVALVMGAGRGPRVHLCALNRTRADVRVTAHRQVTRAVSAHLSATRGPWANGSSSISRRTAAAPYSFSRDSIDRPFRLNAGLRPLDGIPNMEDRSPTPLLSSRDEHGVAQRLFVQAEEKTVGERIARSIVLAAHPDGRVKESDLRFETSSVPEPGENEMLLETQYLSLEPYMRARMEAVKSYTAHLEIGDVMIGQSIARVVVSRHPQFRAGDIVLAWTGWRTLSLSNGQNVRRLDPDLIPPTSWLGILGFAGFAAYVGLRKIAPPAPGETVVVAAASGGVGSLVGQLARPGPEPSELPADRRNAATSRKLSASRKRSITVRPISTNALRPHVPTAWTSISRTSEATSSQRCGRC
jgi:N-terminal domain of oxidoreductase